VNPASGLKNFTNTGDSVATVTFRDNAGNIIDTLVIQPGATRGLIVLSSIGGQPVCYTATCDSHELDCDGLFDCAAANVIVNNGGPISCPSVVPIELNWIDCNGDRVTSGFQGLQTDFGTVSFQEDLGNGRNLYQWSIFGATAGPTTANFTYGDPDNLCTFAVVVPACEELDKQQQLLSDPNRCGYGQNATGGTNLVEVRTEQEFFDAIAGSGNYVCIMPELANTTIIRNTTFASQADNLSIDGSLAPGFKIKVGPSMPTNGYLFRFFGDNIIIHDIEGEGEGYPAVKNNNSFLNIYGENIWIDKVTASLFDDDFVNILLDSDNITVSRVKSFQTNKSVIVFNPNPGQGDTKLTVHSSWMASDQRGPWINAGMSHSFNNLIEKTWAGAGRGDSFINHSDEGYLISENNVYENSTFQTLIGYTGGQNEGYVESVGDTLNGSPSFGGGTTSGNVTFSSIPSLFTLPYDCSDILKPTADVKSYVQSVAGAS
jgi:pectate lyase